MGGKILTAQLIFSLFLKSAQGERHIGNSSERKVVKTVKRRYERWRRKATFCSFLMSSSSSAPFPLLLHFLWELIPGGHIFAHNDVDDDSTSICVSLSFSKPPSLHIKNISVMTRLMNREVIYSV